MKKACQNNNVMTSHRRRYEVVLMSCVCRVSIHQRDEPSCIYKFPDGSHRNMSGFEINILDVYFSHNTGKGPIQHGHFNITLTHFKLPVNVIYAVLCILKDQIII